jgi:ribosomal protein S21
MALSTGVASAVKTHVMGVRVVVREGESVRDALRRLKKAVHHASVPHELHWHSYFISRGQDRRAAKGRAKRKARSAERHRQREGGAGG